MPIEYLDASWSAKIRIELPISPLPFPGYENLRFTETAHREAKKTDGAPDSLPGRPHPPARGNHLARAGRLAELWLTLDALSILARL